MPPDPCRACAFEVRDAEDRVRWFHVEWHGDSFRGWLRQREDGQGGCPKDALRGARLRVHLERDPDGLVLRVEDPSGSLVESRFPG